MTQNQNGGRDERAHAVMLARGGGGGSSSGGGGGGGGSSSSSHSSSSSYSSSGSTGDVPDWIWVIGLLAIIVWIVAKYVLRRELPRHFQGALILVLVAVLGITATGTVGFIVIALPITALVMYVALRSSKRTSALAKAKLPQAAPEIQDRYGPSARELMLRFQQDWSSFNYDSIRSYTTPDYFAHLELILKALQMMNRRNEVSDVSVSETRVLADPLPQTGSLNVHFTAQAKDVLLGPGDKPYYTDTSTFGETYRFKIEADHLLLAGIDEDSADLSRQNQAVVSFASNTGLYYSLDWGRLLLPLHGQLFSGASFASSDINNHTIGRYHNEIIQLYTYDPTGTHRSDNYVIAEVALPRDYGGIIVHAKNSKLPAKLPNGYQSYPTEWNDFNERYELFATDQEKITGFELLEPTYMEKLYAASFPINIEVIDNVVYLYSADPQADYATMLTLLHDAFEALKM
jgi:hypothetical protein